MPRNSKKTRTKVEKVMHEYKRGKLKSGRSGKKVTNRWQTIAIGLSEAKKHGAKVFRIINKTYSPRRLFYNFAIL